MKGYRQTDWSVIWEDGSRTYTNGASDPPHSWAYPPIPPQTTILPVEVADESPAQSGGTYQVPATPIVQARPPVLVAPPVIPPAQVNEPPTAPQSVAVGEPAPTSPQPDQPIGVADTLGAYGQQVRGWWSGLSGTTKVVVGGAGALAVISVLSGKSSR
jgi:hypothetical protein